MIDYPSQQGEDVGDYPLINYYLCNPTTHAHTLMHHCWNLLKKREKYSPWKEAVGQRFLVQKGRQTHTHISGAKGETITDSMIIASNYLHNSNYNEMRKCNNVIFSTVHL